jgi:hypothetical protein
MNWAKMFMYINKWTKYCQNNYIYENQIMWSVIIKKKNQENSDGLSWMS